MSWVSTRDVKFIQMSKFNMFITIVCVLFLTWPIFGYWWAAEDLKPWLCFGQKNPKIYTLFERDSPKKTLAGRPPPPPPPKLSREFQLSSCYTSLNTQFKASKDVGNIDTGML